MRCRHCASTDVYRLGRYGAADYGASLLGYLPYRCSRCGGCFSAMHPAVRRVLLAALVPMAAVVAWWALSER